MNRIQCDEIKTKNKSCQFFWGNDDSILNDVIKRYKNTLILQLSSLLIWNSVKNDAFSFASYLTYTKPLDAQSSSQDKIVDGKEEEEDLSTNKDSSNIISFIQQSSLVCKDCLIK